MRRITIAFVIFFFLSYPFVVWQCKEPKPDNPAVERLQKEISTAFGLLDRQLPDTALLIAQDVYIQASEIDNKTLESKSLTAMALAFRDLGRYPASYNTLEKAMKIRKEIGDQFGVASIYNNLANNYLNEAKYDSAINSAIQAITIYESYGGKSNKDLGQTYLSISEIFGLYGDNEESLIYAKKGCGVHMLNKDTNAIAEALYTVAGSFLKQTPPNLDSAFTYYEMAADYYGKSPGNSANLADIYTNQAEILMHLDKNKSNSSRVWKLLGNSENELRKLTPEESDYFHLYMKKALWYHLYTKDNNSTLQFLKKAMQEHFETENLEDKKYLYNLCSETYENLGQSDSALVFKKLSYQMHDSIFSEIRHQNYARFQTERIKKQNSEQKLIVQKQESRNRLLSFSLLFLVILLGLLVYAYQTRKRAFLIISMQKEKIHQQEIDEFIKNSEVRYLSAHIEGRETEKNYLSNELHGQLGNDMLLIIKEYGELYNKLEPGSPITDQLSILNSNLMGIYENMRDISHQQGSSILEKIGLIPVLEELIEKVNNSGNLHAELEYSGMEQRLPFQYELNLLRIIQELIGNTLKYAKATNFTVQLNKFPDNVNLIVEDNGIGFNMDSISTKQGIGLSSIEKRVLALKGFWQIEPRPGGGVTFIIDIPMPAATDSLPELISEA